MTNHQNLIIPKIQGFSDEHILCTIEEITKGTDYDSIQKLLYSKFGLYCFHADELIEKILENTDLKSPFRIEQNCHLTQKLIEDGYKQDEIEDKIQEITKTESKKKAGVDTLTLIFGVISLSVVYMVFFSGLDSSIGYILLGSTAFFKNFLLEED